MIIYGYLISIFPLFFFFFKECTVLFQGLKILLSRNSYNSKLIFLTWRACIGFGRHTARETYICVSVFCPVLGLSVIATNSLKQRTYTTLKHGLSLSEERRYENVYEQWKFIKHFQKTTFRKQVPCFGKDERRQKAVSS